MTETVKVTFSGETYKGITQKLIDNISDYNNELNTHTMNLSVSTKFDDTRRALEFISLISMSLSKISSILHSLESAYNAAGTKVKQKLTIDIELDSLAMLREYLTELIGEANNKLSDGVFKMQTIVKVGQKMKESTSLMSAQEIQTFSNQISEYSNILVIVEEALEGFFDAKVQKLVPAK